MVSEAVLPGTPGGWRSIASITTWLACGGKSQSWRMRRATKAEALRVVGRLPHGVRLVEPDVVQKCSRAQYLPVVSDVFRSRQVLRQGVNPQAVGVPVAGCVPILAT